MLFISPRISSVACGKKSSLVSIENKVLTPWPLGLIPSTPMQPHWIPQHPAHLDLFLCFFTVSPIVLVIFSTENRITFCEKPSWMFSGRITLFLFSLLWHFTPSLQHSIHHVYDNLFLLMSVPPLDCKML